METLLLDSSLTSGSAAPSQVPTFAETRELTYRLMELGALATQAQGAMHIAVDNGCGHDPTLLSIKETLRKVETAREAAAALNLPLCVLACTQARVAKALQDDADPRDRRFTTGAKNQKGFHTYCGGVDAAISRALIYAQYADVVCYRTESIDLTEATRFASAVKSSFPLKRLGFSYTPTPEAPRWNELDHRAFAGQLRQIGYDFYFVTHFGRISSPFTPMPVPWVLLHDALPSESEDLADAPGIAAHGMRYPTGNIDRAARRTTPGRPSSNDSQFVRLTSENHQA